ncbi:YcxB family protein [Mucilaginibacter sp. UR6-1]|uniref:YcxB family protein n=1 Tax=Mucilaginibacter sp. UR6-1 TaxID=1435643 RepID=UPI001E4AD571|nr:YcxB family protein [Mucilaginibacter sp. UR6-1]MCC8407384.1 YcxB family protein [Mucilaginibacter sp. UR6-1]
MKISTQITLPEYRKLQYTLLYTKLIFVWVTLCGLVMFVAAIVQLLNGEDANGSSISFGLGFGLLVILMPLFIYISSSKTFKSLVALNKPTKYEFLSDRLIIDTAVGHTEMPWENYYKIKELSNWFLLYQNANVANLIPKTNLSEQDIVGIRYILQNAPVKKKKLKK